jgi:hypothetical protein
MMCTPFLYGKLNVEFYIEQPEGYENDVIMMWKFKENIELQDSTT